MNYSALPIIVCVIAFTGRHDLVRCNVALLKKQSIPIKTLLVGSSKKDQEVAEECGVDHYLHFPNRPLGRKWQAGISEVQKVFPEVDAVLINGSDDFLSPHYAERAYARILAGADLVGKKDWCVFDHKINKGYYIRRNIYSVLGAGRMWSLRFLNKIDWQLFPEGLNNQLDAMSYKKLVGAGGKYKIIKDPKMMILSIKGNHGVLSSTKAVVRDTPALSLDVGMGKVLMEVNEAYQNKDYNLVYAKMGELEEVN